MKKHTLRENTLRYIITELILISRDTLDKNEILSNNEYLEHARKILDRLAQDGIIIDYNVAEEAEKASPTMIFPSYKQYKKLKERRIKCQ